MSSSSTPPKYALKIINPAFGRAGTTSLAKALDILGFGPTWHMMLNSNSKNNYGINWWIKNKMDEKIENNEITNKDIDEWLNHIECNTIMDAPIGAYWSIFCRFYPNAKVIVCTRNYWDIHESAVRLFNSVVNTWWFDLIICRVQPNAYWAKYVLLPNYFKFNGWKSMDQFVNADKELVDKNYNLHLTQIKNTISSQQELLIFNVKDGWKPLCKFLNVEIPKNIPFPHKNKGSSMRSTVLQNALRDEYKTYLAFGGLLLLAMAAWYKYRK